MWLFLNCFRNKGVSVTTESTTKRTTETTTKTETNSNKREKETEITKQKKASSRSQAPSQEHQLHQQQQQVQTGNQEIANDQHHQQQQHQQQQQQHFHNQGTGHNYALGFIQPTFDSQYPNKSPNVLASTDSLFPRLSSYDLKSKDSKYKRWTPRMDQLLIKLLSDVVHSYPRGAEPEMNKKLGCMYVNNYGMPTRRRCTRHIPNIQFCNI